MTKREIVKWVTEKCGISQLLAKEVVQETLDAMVEQIVKEGRLELRNFGVFEVKERKQRVARNPRTGEKVMVPKRKVVTFKPGKIMEARVKKG
ncbi:MAG: integration host factor subunit beta [Planctomycetota bacterium]|nr:integration host factor subunit beta [Planctomycetota bacterium]